jgi:hypothetical protein
MRLLAACTLLMACLNTMALDGSPAGREASHNTCARAVRELKASRELKKVLLDQRYRWFLTKSELSTVPSRAARRRFYLRGPFGSRACCAPVMRVSASTLAAPACTLQPETPPLSHRGGLGQGHHR